MKGYVGAGFTTESLPNTPDQQRPASERTMLSNEGFMWSGMVIGELGAIKGVGPERAG